MTRYREDMTPEETAKLLREAEELDAAYARAEAFDAARRYTNEDGDKLDAYGHLTWVVGNEDWLACFDAIRVADGVAYEVVVNCESGGFIETTESGIVPASEAVAKLADLPWSYFDTMLENYAADEDDPPPSDEEVKDCAERWRAHLEAVAAEPAPEPEEEEHESDGYAELRRAALDHRGRP